MIYNSRINPNQCIGIDIFIYKLALNRVLTVHFFTTVSIQHNYTYRFFNTIK